MGLQLNLIDAIQGPNAAEQYLHLPAGALPPLYTTDHGGVWRVASAKVQGKERLLVLVPKAMEATDEDGEPTRWIWTNCEHIAAQLLSIQLS